MEAGGRLTEEGMSLGHGANPSRVSRTFGHARRWLMCHDHNVLSVCHDKKLHL